MQTDNNTDEPTRLDVVATLSDAADTTISQPEDNSKDKGERHRELENLAGNFLITNWQLEEIGDRLARLGHDYDVVKGSSVVFKNGKDWFKLTVKLEKEEGIVE